MIYNIVKETEKASMIEFFFYSDTGYTKKSHDQKSFSFWMPKASIINDDSIVSWFLSKIKEHNSKCRGKFNLSGIKYGIAPLKSKVEILEICCDKQNQLSIDRCKFTTDVFNQSYLKFWMLDENDFENESDLLKFRELKNRDITKKVKVYE